MKLHLKSQFIQAIEILRGQKPQIITFTKDGVAVVVETSIKRIVLTTVESHTGREPNPNTYVIWTENDTYENLVETIVPWKMKTIIGISILVENEMM